ncbi:BgTH12-00976 [Blumeria graminis f. sp. triticale]|uniref:BgTH12-00976 n=1 Tax=Blumeria graminis f. sp. triticale TaxID=1689686 RepID=A0A9W4DCU1_BLUGR|nr:BgTH12-00976 [Blumeria graminis f. sp. triticale]
MLQQEEYKYEEAAESPATINQALNGLKCPLSFKEHKPDTYYMELTILFRME